MADDPYEGTDVGGGRREFRKPNYSGNSKKDKEEAEKDTPRVEKVVEGEVIQRKKPLARRIADTFTGEDIHSVGEFVIFEVIIPATKNLITEVVKEGIERMMFPGGMASRPGSFRSPSTANRGLYSTTSRLSSSQPVPQMSYRGRATHDFQEIILPSRVEAQEVLEGLVGCIEEFGWATVKDLYDLVGVTGSFIDHKWGWTDLRQAGVRRLPRGGFLLELPRPIQIDD